MSRDLLHYGFNATLAIAGLSVMINPGNENGALSRIIYPQGASVFVSGVSTATLSNMVLMPTSLEIRGPAPLYFRSTGSSGAVNIFTSTSQATGVTQSIGY